MKALKKHIKLITRLVEGDFNHNRLSKDNLSIEMICNDFGYYGDIDFNFYQDDRHILSYDTQLASGKAKKGEYSNESPAEVYKTLIAQLKLAMIEMGFND